MGMCLIAASSEILSTLEPYWYYFQVAIGLGFVIFVHELGHFAVAKFCGVKCEKFYVGFDVPMPKIGPFQIPSSLLKFQWGETEYGIGIIPLGGYVKMLGQDDNPMNAEQEAERIRAQTDATADGEPSDEGEATTSSETTEAAPVELDPRSYPAKSVPQRMAIISAGVIMNLIFGIIFAMVAYLAGVRYTPCEIGSTSPGDPAWQAGLTAGDTIIQLKKSGEPREHLRFEHDLKSRVLHAGLHDVPKPIDLLIRAPGGETRWVQLTPTAKLRELTQLTTIGVSPRRKTIISKVNQASSAEKATPELKVNDRIIAVDGQALPVDPQSGETYVNDLYRLLATKLGEDVVFTCERTNDTPDATGEPSTQQFQTTVRPMPLRLTGLQMEIGPIVSIRQGSPAETAGFQAGDVIRSVNGKSIADPMLLPYQFADLIDQEVTFEVSRPAQATPTSDSGETSPTDDTSTNVTIKVTPTGDFQLSEVMGLGAFVGIENVGIAYSVKLRVAEVEANTPAAQAGLQSGDTLTQLQILTETDAERERAEKLFGKDYGKPQQLSDSIYNWPLVFAGFQGTPGDVKWQITYQRGEEQKTVVLTTESSDTYFALNRGLSFQSVSRIHTASSISEAAYLGCRESVERGTEILSVLQKLFTGKLSIRNLGGPLRIFEGASREASAGVPRLLMFLTFLSVNLAILNFLPIPALDGGHMVFLLYEGVTRKPPNEKVQGMLTLVGVGLLLCLMIFVFANDILTMFFN